MILDSNIIGTSSEYFADIYECSIDDIPVDFDETGDSNLISIEQYNLVGNIIALQVSFFCLRRLSNSCESNSDFIKSMLNSEIKKYEEKYGEFKNNNKDLIW